MKQLGDTHNFGQSVRRIGDWVEKPRPLYWEWLFFGEDSPLQREFLAQTLSPNAFHPFQWYPQLKFQFEDKPTLVSSGKVQYFENAELDKLNSDEMARGFGATLANSYFWGITDLHLENIAMGYDPMTGKEVLFPIDIESLFLPHELVSQSYLLKSIHNKNNWVAANRILGAHPNSALICETFFESIQFYNKNLQKLCSFLEGLNLEQYPVRCILKDTKLYVDNMQEPSPELSFFEEEKIQMRRGDVPYFFTFINDPSIYYLGNEGPQKLEADWQHAFGDFECRPLQSKNLLKSIEDKNFKYGIMQIGRTFDPKKELELKTNNFSVKYKGDFIYFDVPNGWRLKCQRPPY